MLLPVIAALGALGFVLAVVAAHWLRPDLAPCQATLSVYFSGRTRALMFAAYLALALDLLSVSSLLVSAPPSYPRAFTAMVCMLATLCLIPIAFTTRRDLSLPDTRTLFAVRAHRWAALLAFASIVAAILCHATCIGMRAWQRSCAMVLGVVALLALLAMVMSKPGPYHGGFQKIMIAALALWIWLVCLSEGMAYR